ncbi:hypothetical protein Pla52n_02920 [Stieleria varia]|uniref:Uncharacterized protein n=1 Tax=Stieleria varia TaxID=2528005 RepID=A0A5C6B8T9_9BACT|nr:hypothetical protein Pla52n_02920 [Stieleria varia]
MSAKRRCISDVDTSVAQVSKLLLVHRPVLILGLAVLALATVESRKPWLTPKRLIYQTHVPRLDDALVVWDNLFLA